MKADDNNGQVIFSWPSTEPVQLIVSPSSQGATTAQPQQQQLNPGTVGGGGTPGGFALPAQTVTTVEEGVVAGAAGIGTGLIAAGLASNYGTAEDVQEAIDDTVGSIVEDWVLHSGQAHIDFKKALEDTRAEADGLSATSAVSPPESAPESVQQSSGDLIEQLQDSLHTEQDHLQGSPPESPTVVQQTPINLADPTQVQHALDGFNQSVQSSQDLQDALSTYSGKSVTLQIDDNQITVQINQNGLSLSTPTDPKNDMFVKFTSNEIKQLRKDLAGGSEIKAAFSLAPKLMDGTTRNVGLDDIKLAVSLAKNLGKMGSAPK